jgi:enoyl-CoA hydratase/carnithine racemase
MSEHQEDIRTAVDGAVATITLLGESRLNALRRSFWPSMREALAAFESDAEVRAIVVTGSGSRAFSAGGDINEYGDLTDTLRRREFIVDCMRTFEAIRTCTKPVIAAVNGLAMGGGFELALACDIIIASRSAVFAVPEARLGLLPGFGISQLSDVVGPGWARYLVFTGESISAEKAASIGLVQEVVDEEELSARAAALAERIAESAPLALAAGKNIFRDVMSSSPTTAIDAIVMLQATDDANEGIRSFTESRSPRFTGQ